MSSEESSHIEESEPLIEEPLTPITEVLGMEGPEPLVKVDTEDPKRVLTPYETWKADPSQDNLYTVTKSLKPTIDSVLASIGGAGSPNLAAKARVVAAKAVQSYNPDAGTSLPTWVSNQLRQLTRDVRKSNNIMSVPDGVQLDAYNIYKAEQEFIDKYDREPSVEELADKAHLSIKRIADVRRKLRPVNADSAYQTEEGDRNEAAVNMTDFSKDATDYIYNESDLTDKKILEYTLGYGGAKELDNKTIMAKLKLTPVQLTRRKTRLSMRINDIINDLESIQ